jgi:hypothetical protein
MAVSHAKARRREAEKTGLVIMVRRYFRCLNLFKKLTRRRGDAGIFLFVAVLHGCFSREGA